jgi:putative phage-type endonuclease
MNSRADWLEQRRKTLGGSDAAAALGLSPWKTRLSLYREKRGEVADQPQSAAMEWGELLEPVIVEAYRRKTGHRVLTGEATRPFVGVSPYPFMACNIDGLVVQDDDVSRRWILEAKLASREEEWGEPGTDQVPSHYIPQAQHMMAVTGMQVVEFAVLLVRFGLREIQTYTVPRDGELIDMLVEQERELWQRIVDGNPPDPSTPEEIRLRWPTSTDVAREASIEIVAAVDMLAQAREAKRAAEAKEAEFAAVVQLYMEDAGALTYQGRTLATWKQNRETTYFDKDAFAAAHPAIYAQFTAKRPGNRPLLIKKG